MNVTSGNINPSYYELANSQSSVEGIRRKSSSNSYSGKNSFFGKTPEDQNGKIVSETPDKHSTIKDYNLHLHQNTPASKSQPTAKTFNETKKNISAGDEDVIELQETDDYEKVRNSSEGGYYIVIDEKQQKGITSRIKSAADLWRERIDKIYHAGIRKQPGVLVNLVA